MGYVLQDLIRKYEGLRKKAYLCPAGVPTIGYGATGPDIHLGMEWTLQQCEARLVADSKKHLDATKKLAPMLTGDNLDAIADFVYNLGPTRFAGSTLRKRIMAGDIPGAKVELMKWTRGGGRILPGLVLRRREEASYLK